MSSNESSASKLYNEQHRVLSFRIEKKDADRFDELLAKEGKSKAEFFRQALEIEERNYDEARKRGYRQGRRKVREEYGLMMKCAFCGRMGHLKDEAMKECLAIEHEGLVICTECMDLQSIEELKGGILEPVESNKPPHKSK